MTTTPNLGLTLPAMGDGIPNGKPWGTSLNGNFTILDGATMRADLASTASAAVGDALVGVKFPGTGGAARTGHEKNQDVITNADFTDMQAFLTYVGTNGGNYKILPGTYAVPAMLTLSHAASVIWSIDAKGVIRYKQIGPFTPEAIQTKLIPLVQQLQKEAGNG